MQMDAYTPDLAIREKQAELNRLYDDFSGKYGLINDRGNRLAFSDDSSYYLLCALEVLDEDGKLERKADMFTKRTIKPHEAVTSVDTASEALGSLHRGESQGGYGVYGPADRQAHGGDRGGAVRRDLPRTRPTGTTPYPAGRPPMNTFPARSVRSCGKPSGRHSATRPTCPTWKP